MLITNKLLNQARGSGRSGADVTLEFCKKLFIEQMGTGIGRMRDAARNANVAEPEFEFNGFFRVTFRRNPLAVSGGRQSVVYRSLSVAASDRKQAIVAYLKEHGHARVSELAGIIGLSDGRVRALLREMAGDGIIIKVGDKRHAHYILKP